MSLTVPLLIYCGLALCLAALFAALSPRWRRPFVLTLAITFVALLLLQSLYLEDRLAIVRLVPAANAIIWANLSLPVAGALGGLILSLKPKPGGKPHPLWRRATLAAALLAVATWRTGRPIWSTRAETGVEKWRDGVCRQTSVATCSAAAAATLLRAHGISATEAELVDLCLTTNEGSRNLGIYRALKLKTQNTPYQVRTFTGSYQDFLKLNAAPALISVGLPANAAHLDPRYQKDWGWTPGINHSVILLAHLPNQKVEIGDPSVGKEQWFEQGVQDLWNFKAYWLEKTN